MNKNFLYFIVFKVPLVFFTFWKVKDPRFNVFQDAENYVRGLTLEIEVNRDHKDCSSSSAVISP